MCETSSWRLEFRPLPPYSISIYTCGVTATLRVCGDLKEFINEGLKTIINKPFWENFNITFYEKYKKCQKNLIIFFFFHKKFLKIFYKSIPFCFGVYKGMK